MSINDDIQARISELLDKQLFHLPPLLGASGDVREMYVSKDVFDAVTDFSGNYYDAARMQAFRATLDQFTNRERISVSESPFDKEPDTYLARVDPTGRDVWQIRCFKDLPQIRCFGRFGGKDTFIALTWDLRCNIDHYSEAIYCERRWVDLFNNVPCFKGRNLNEYLTNYRLSET